MPLFFISVTRKIWPAAQSSRYGARLKCAVNTFFLNSHEDHCGIRLLKASGLVMQHSLDTTSLMRDVRCAASISRCVASVRRLLGRFSRNAWIACAMLWRLDDALALLFFSVFVFLSQTIPSSCFASLLRRSPLPPSPYLRRLCFSEVMFSQLNATERQKYRKKQRGQQQHQRMCARILRQQKTTMRLRHAESAKNLLEKKNGLRLTGNKTHHKTRVNVALSSTRSNILSRMVESQKMTQ